MANRTANNWKGTAYPVAVPYYKQMAIPEPVTTADLFRPRPYPHRRLTIAGDNPEGTMCNSRPDNISRLRSVPGSQRYAPSSGANDTNAFDAPEFSRITTPCDNNPINRAHAEINHPTVNALRAIRRGNGRRIMNESTGETRAFFSTAEYLHNRVKLFEQNNFHYIQSGDSTALPGTPAASANVYAPHGPATCPKYFIGASSGNNTFVYTWIDGSQNTVEIPDGWYTLATFQNAVQLILFNSGHYYDDGASHYYYLIKFVYNPDTERISLVLTHPSVYVDAEYTTPGEPEDIGEGYVNPVVDFSGSTLGPAGLGFTERTVYDFDNEVGTWDADQNGKLLETFKRTYYKPSNPKFAATHAVQSSERTLRLQYDTINKTAATFTAPYGQGNANAMAYGVMRDARVEKNKHNLPPYQACDRKCFYRI